MSCLSSLNDRRKRAFQEVAAFLADKTNFIELDSEDPKDDTSELKAWKTTIEAKGREWDIIIVLTNEFPDIPPRVKVIEGDDLMLKIPHAFDDGDLCIIPESAGIDSNKPVDLFIEVIESTKKILEGKEMEGFQDEFSVYWNRSLKRDHKTCIIIDSPEILDTSFEICNVGQNLILAAAATNNMLNWLRKRNKNEKKVELVKNGILLKLDAPLLPVEYPDTLSYLINMLLQIKNAKRELELLIRLITTTQHPILLLLAQKTNNGYALGGLNFNNIDFHSDLITNSKQSIHDIINKLRPFTERIKVTRCSVERADYSWIHARANDDGNYLDHSVLLLGCGSLGGYIAHYLVKAGVTNLTIIDPDILSWSNIGRHILGAESQSKFKSEALAESLKRQMPHLNISGICKKWQDALRENENLFDNFDVVISAIGDWRSEGPLNWISKENKLPPILFGWLEPYAVAGHSLVSVNGSGCLACEMNEFGRFQYSVSRFQGTTLKREPGGCTEYQQYGPVALLPVASLIVKDALRCLNGPPQKSELKTWISDREHFWSTDALITPKWKERIDLKGYSRVYYSSWDSKKGCRVCT